MHIKNIIIVGFKSYKEQKFDEENEFSNKVNLIVGKKWFWKI